MENKLNFGINQEAEQQVSNHLAGQTCQENHHHHQNGSLLHSLHVVVVFESNFGKAKTTRKIDLARSQIIDHHQ